MNYTHIKAAKNGSLVPFFEQKPLHSTYEPEKEAQRFANALSPSRFFVILGLAGGYHISALLKRFPDAATSLPARSKRFCWSGINYAWCGGVDIDGSPVFGPCFRAVECAARPAGEFWKSREWELFRESLLDGTFRYCQKNQCSNIIGDWLPRKERVPDIKIGDLPVELHLSYDSYCNLCCPSCRTAFVHNSDEETRKLDCFYEFQ